MTAGAGLLFDRGGEVGERFGKALSAGIDEPGVPHGLLPQLLLEQRVQHDRADACVREPPDALDGVRQRRRGRYEWIAQLEAHVAGRQIHHLSLALVARLHPRPGPESGRNGLPLAASTVRSSHAAHAREPMRCKQRALTARAPAHHSRQHRGDP